MSELKEYFCVTDMAHRVLAVGSTLSEVQEQVRRLDTLNGPAYVETGLAFEPPFVGQQLLPARPDASLVDYSDGGADVVPHVRIDQLVGLERPRRVRRWTHAVAVYHPGFQRAIGWCEAEPTGEVY